MRTEHTWVGGGMYVDSEDVQTVATVRTVECEQCGVVYGSAEHSAVCGEVAPSITEPHMFRGRMVEQVRTQDVRVGDRLCLWLSNASAYPSVTGWSDRTLSPGTPYESVHRTFTVTGTPWWVDASDCTSAIADGLYGMVFILARS